MPEMTPLAYGSRSPDGRWWWDGQTWQPVPDEAFEGPPGTPRRIGICILLAVVTLGIYTLVWTYRTQREIKDHSGIGVGGGFGLLIFILVSPVTFFLVPADVNAMYRRKAMDPPVSVLTGLWVLLPLVGHLVWFVSVQGALNDYWAAVTRPRS